MRCTVCREIKDPEQLSGDGICAACRKTGMAKIKNTLKKLARKDTTTDSSPST